jgi:hypothetical protein
MYGRPSGLVKFAEPNRFHAKLSVSDVRTVTP